MYARIKYWGYIIHHKIQLIRNAMFCVVIKIYNRTLQKYKSSKGLMGRKISIFLVNNKREPLVSQLQFLARNFGEVCSSPAWEWDGVVLFECVERSLFLPLQSFVFPDTSL